MRGVDLSRKGRLPMHSPTDDVRGGSRADAQPDLAAGHAPALSTAMARARRQEPMLYAMRFTRKGPPTEASTHRRRCLRIRLTDGGPL